MEEKEGIIARFIQIRKNRNITQIELGNLLGISGSAVAQMERGKTIINEKHIKLICGALRINEEWLRSGTGDMIKKGRTAHDMIMLDIYCSLSLEGKKLVLDYMNYILNNEKKMRGEDIGVEKGDKQNSTPKAG